MRFPSPSTFNFDNDADSRHIALFGMQGSGVSTICRQVMILHWRVCLWRMFEILLHFESEDAENIKIDRDDASKDQEQMQFEGKFYAEAFYRFLIHTRDNQICSSGEI